MSKAVTTTSPGSSMLRRVTIASSIGTALEWFDFSIWAILSATVFPSLFFPGKDPAVGLMASFAALGVGYGARPLGAVVFGYLGDRFGRKNLLLVTMSTMGVVTAAIGFLPTYQDIGLWASGLMVLLRLVQGMALGGESTGGQVLTLEHAPRHKRGLYGSFTQIGNSASQAASSGLLALLSAVQSKQDFLAFGWRIPFILSLVLVGIGIYMRMRVDESPAFVHAVAEQKVSKKYVLRSHPWTILRLTFTWGGFVLTALALNPFGAAYVKQLGMSNDAVFMASMISTLIPVITLVLGGWVSDRIGRRKTLLIGVCYEIVVFIPFFPLLNTVNAALVTLAMTLVQGGLAFIVGVLPAFFAEPFPTSVRYSGSALGYTGSQIFFAAPFPVIFSALLVSTKSPLPIILIVMAGLLLTLVLVWFSKETAGVDFISELDGPAEGNDPKADDPEPILGALPALEES